MTIARVRDAKVHARARALAESEVERIDVGLPEMTVDNMEAITGAIAAAFVMGYAAALDDQTPARPLRGDGGRRVKR